MSEDIAWEFLGNVSFGTIVSWIILISIFIGVISMIVVKLYKLFLKSRSIKEEKDSFAKMLKDHDESLKIILEELKNIRIEQKESKERELKKLRHDIVRAGEEAICDDHISIRKLRSLEELYSDYTGFTDENGKPANGYVRSLMNKVRELEVKGMLDDNGDDIDGYE